MNPSAWWLRQVTYSKREVAGILRGMSSANLDNKNTQVRLIDVLRAVGQLTDKQREAVFLIDVCHLHQEEAADYCNITQQSMWERHNRGILNVVNYLNGETYTK